MAFSTVSQFFAPAELAAIPTVVPKGQLLYANGLFALTVSGAQLMGFVIVGPVLAKSLEGPAVFLFLSLVYLVCTLLIWLMRMEEPEIAPDGLDLKTGWVGALVVELKEGWRLLAQDNAVSLPIMHLTLVNSMMLVIGMLAPGYVSRVLGIRADDSFYVMAPAGIGMLAGISLLPRLAHRWAKELLANVGIFLTASALYLLGVVGRLGHILIPKGFFQRIGLGAFPEELGLVGIVVMLALLLGIGYSLVNVSAQTLVQERVPFDLRGRIFATQFAFANAAAVVPLLFLGGLADLVGISQVTLLSATVVLVAGIFSSFQTRRLRPFLLGRD
jgi:MFS family permease